MNSPNKEPRYECDAGIIFFKDQGFGIDSNKFKKLRDTDEINDYCVEHCNMACSIRTRILSILTNSENERIKSEQM